MEKIKVLTISDSPLSFSGVGNQTKYVIDALLESGKFSVVSLGGAIKHRDYKPVKTEEWGDDWLIYPVDGYGTKEIVRSIVRNEKPDMLWFMTDPRFWDWLWDMDHEIRSLMPMIYYHVWDNYPYPKFNRAFYLSNDLIATISKVTDDIVKTVVPEIKSVYLPHTVDTDIFKKFEEEEFEKKRKEIFPNEAGKNKFTFLWNGRNARRKQSGTIIWWFSEFLEKVGKDTCRLIMHTDPKDPHGQDLEAILSELKLTNGEVLISKQKYPPEAMALLNNIADCSINISDAEGFGLPIMESLSCGTPAIVTMTGGLQEQITNGEEWFGIGIEPCAKSVIGSQSVPYIHEDRISKEDFLDALETMFFMDDDERETMGMRGREHILNNYGFEKFKEKWVDLMTKTYEENGSWEDRKNYLGWGVKEI